MLKPINIPMDCQPETIALIIQHLNFKTPCVLSPPHKTPIYLRPLLFNTSCILRLPVFKTPYILRLHFHGRSIGTLGPCVYQLPWLHNVTYIIVGCLDAEFESGWLGELDLQDNVLTHCPCLDLDLRWAGKKTWHHQGNMD